jgi:hypothetical protein
MELTEDTKPGKSKLVPRTMMNEEGMTTKTMKKMKKMMKMMKMMKKRRALMKKRTGSDERKGESWDRRR